MIGGFSTRDGTLDFYLRIRSLATSDMTVLDLGAGRAAWFEDGRQDFVSSLRKMKGYVRSLIAADVDPVVMNNRACDSAVLIEEGHIPLQPDAVDLIICDFVLEHVDDPKSFIDEVERVLKPGGWFCARTPHKYCYVALLSRLLPNRFESAMLSRAQPGRKSEDVFPKRYKMNRLKNIAVLFPGWDNESFIYRSEPSYHCGRQYMYNIMDFIHRIMPAFFSGTLMIFVQKPYRRQRCDDLCES